MSLPAATVRVSKCGARAALRQGPRAAPGGTESVLTVPGESSGGELGSGDGLRSPEDNLAIAALPGARGLMDTSAAELTDA